MGKGRDARNRIDGRVAARLGARMSRLLLAFAIFVALVGHVTAADNSRFDYDPPPIDGCDAANGPLSSMLSDTACLLLYTQLVFSAGLVSDDDNVLTDARGHLRLGLVQETATGPLFAVATLTSARDFYWGDYGDGIDAGADFFGPNYPTEWDAGDSESGWGYTSGMPRFDEYYVGYGEAFRVQAGKVETILNFEDDEPLDEVDQLLPEIGWSFDQQPWLLASEKGHSHSLQAITELAPGVTVGVAAEDIDHGGSLLGVLEYDRPGYAGHLSLAQFSSTDQGRAWGIHFSHEVVVGPVTVLGAGAYDNSGYWHGLASGIVDVTWAKAALSYERMSTEDRAIGGSLQFQPTDSLSFIVGGRAGSYADGSESQLFSIEATLEVSENLEVSAELGRVNDPWGGVAYATGRLDWYGDGGFDAQLEAELTDYGAYSVAATLQQVLR